MTTRNEQWLSATDCGGWKPRPPSGRSTSSTAVYGSSPVYYVERAHSVTGPWPDRLAAITMPLEGVVDFVDTTGLTTTQSFYRTSLR